MHIFYNAILTYKISFFERPMIVKSVEAESVSRLVISNPLQPRGL